MIQKGNTITVHYTGRYENGDIFDSSIGKEPLTFKVGEGNIINGFENAILGKEIGDKVEVDIEPIDAYGDYREDLLIEVPNSSLPGPVEVGMSLQAQAENGMPINVTVKEVKEDSVIVDANHPLSGKRINFSIEIINID